RWSPDRPHPNDGCATPGAGAILPPKLRREETAMTSLPTFFPARTRLTLWIAAAVGVSLLTWSLSGRPKPIFDARCEAWDSAAAASGAELAAARTRAGEQGLGDFGSRLRRARAYCRFGLVSLAHLDYQALLDGRYAGYRLSSTKPASAQGGR